MRTLPPSRSRRLSLRTFFAKAEKSANSKKTSSEAKRRQMNSMVFNVHVVPIVHLHYCPGQLHTMYCRIADFATRSGVPMNRTFVGNYILKGLVPVVSLLV